MPAPRMRTSRLVTGGVAAASLCLLLSACGSSSSGGAGSSPSASTGSSAAAPSSPSSSAPAASKLKSILFVNPLPSYPGWAFFSNCMKSQAQKISVPYSSEGPTGGSINTNFMLARIQQAIADHVGAIVTFPVSGPQFTPVLAQAKKAGILTATAYGGGSTTVQNFDAGVNYAQSARADVAALAARPGTQKVGIIVATATPPSSTWSDAFKAAAAKTSNVSVVTVQYDQGDATKDVDLAANMMTANPDINIIATNEGAATPGVASAIKQAGRLGKVFLAANNKANGGIQAVANGSAYGTLLANSCGAAAQVVNNLEALHQGKQVPAEINIPLKFVTKSDYKTYVAQKWQ